MKNKTGKLKLNKSILVLAISLALAILISVGTVTYAVFTNSMHAQRTIAAYDEASDRFSSNQLIKGSSQDNVRTIYVTSASIAPTTLITVCNYDQGNQLSPHTDTITYRVDAKFVRYDEGEGEYVNVDASYITSNSLGSYTVSIAHSDNDVGDTITLGGGTVSGSISGKSLPASTATSEQLEVIFSTDFVAAEKNLYLEVTVTPTGSLPTLSGIFKTGLRAAGATVSWLGEFTDNTAYAPSTYDGFNYRITGTGSGTFTLKWDNSKVRLSYDSYIKLMSIAGATSTINDGLPASVSFHVDSNNVSVYEIQFYKASILSTDKWAASAPGDREMNEELPDDEEPLTAVVGFLFEN